MPKHLRLGGEVGRGGVEVVDTEIYRERRLWLRCAMPSTDFRELALLVGVEHLEEMRDRAHEWGYGME